MAEVRFWDTSALVKIFDSSEPDHRRARGLWSGPRSRRVRQVSSVLVAVEAVRKFYRTVPEEVGTLLEAIDALDLVYLDDRVLPVALELAKHSVASGADTAIVASAVAIKRGDGKDVELVTADAVQAGLAAREGLGVVRLSASRG
jgi:predicted nucleic acid-binding protein